MNALVPASQFIPVDDVSEFFAPVSHNELDELVLRRELVKKELEALSHTVLSAKAGAMGYFISANLEKDSHVRVNDLFNLERGILQLDSDMWHRAMRLTDVWDYMPQARRSQWDKQLRAWKDERGYQKGKNPELDMLPFERDAVVSTIKQLLSMRSQFFSEKVDGIFSGLSGEHVTNSPMGFGKRMIIADALNDGYSNSSKSGLIDDLRHIIAKFRGMPEKLGISSYDLLQRCYRTRTGEWFDIDGGALRIRVYKVGTAHMEVHEDISWKLNKVLAAMHPATIPAQFRQKPKKRKVKDFNLFDDLLPSPVRSLIGEMRAFNGAHNAFYLYGTYNVDKAIVQAAEAVLFAVGGVKVEREYKADRWGHDIRKQWVFEFDYGFETIRDEIAGNGRIPNQKSHQFYPTPPAVAEKVIELASEGATPGMNWLEPSAGIGGIADFVPEDAYLQCYEISNLHCMILESKGFVRAGKRAVSCLDFLKLAEEYRGGGYDRIVMNPPFSEGRWQDHLEAASCLLKKNGRLVCVLPSSAKAKGVLPGWQCEWTETLENQFADTSIDVVILVATRH